MKEKLSISFLCVTNQKPFKVTLSREGGTGEKFSIEAIVRTEPQGTALQKESAEVHTARRADLDFDGFFCPHCANRSFVKCHCGVLSCFKEDRQDNERVLLACGHSGILSGSIEDMDGSRQDIGTGILTGGGKVLSWDD